MDYSKLKVGTIITFNNEDYFVIPDIPSFAWTDKTDFYYKARAVAYNLTTGKKIGDTRVGKSEISEHQLSKEEKKVFLIKLQMSGYLDKSFTVDQSYDSIRNVSCMQDGIAVIVDIEDNITTILLGTNGIVQKLRTRRVDDVYCIISTEDVDLKSRLVVGDKVEIEKLVVPTVKEVKVAENNVKKICTHMKKQYEKMISVTDLTMEKFAGYCISSLTKSELQSFVSTIYSRALSIYVRRIYSYNGKEFMLEDKKIKASVKKYFVQQITLYIINLYHITERESLDQLVQHDFPNVKLGPLYTSTIVRTAIKEIMKFPL